MKPAFKKFLFNLLIFSLILVLLTVLLSFIMPEGILSGWIPYLFILFIVVTAGVYFMTMKMAERSARSFVTGFMAATFIKLFLYFAIIIIYALFVKVEVISFVLTFFIMYLMYTIFEVIMVVRQSGKDTSYSKANKSISDDKK